MSLLEIGQVIRPHGLRGEVVVALVTNRLDRIAPGSVLATSAPTPRRATPALEVATSRPFQNRYLVCFVGVSSREAAEELRGLTLLAEPPSESDGELYVHQLIGRTLVDQHGVGHGTVVAVEANPASDLLVLESGSLVPLRFVTGGDEATILVEVPDGLFE